MTACESKLEILEKNGQKVTMRKEDTASWFSSKRCAKKGKHDHLRAEREVELSGQRLGYSWNKKENRIFPE